MPLQVMPVAAFEALQCADFISHNFQFQLFAFLPLLNFCSL
jgi:hypothetical protein